MDHQTIPQEIPQEILDLNCVENNQIKTEVTNQTNSISKRMIITLKEEQQPRDIFYNDNKQIFITKDEYPSVMLDHRVTQEEVEKSIDTIITYFAQEMVYKLSVDLNARNLDKAPVKEVTMTDIENAFKSRVKIVNPEVK